MSHCVTVLSAADVFVYVGTAIDVVIAVGLTSGCEVCVAVMRQSFSRIFFAAFRQMSSIVVVAGRIKAKSR